MDEAAKERTQREIKDTVDELFPGAVERVEVLRHGDDPVVEPGEILLRVFVAPQGPDGQERKLRDFERAHRPQIERFRREVSERLPQAQTIQITRDDGRGDRKVIMIRLGPPGVEGGREGAPPAGDLTPVMARLGPADLDTVDTLITAGIAANRAEAVRWALARVRERPAYAQVRERIDEIERLKAEF